MSSLKELKTQIEDANALGIANLTEKGVEIPETATTYDIMSKIVEVSGNSGKEEQEKTITITENGTTEILPDENKALSKVTVVTDVEGITPLDNTVTFTVDGEPYEIVSVKSGNGVNRPVKSGVKWFNENGNIIKFPYYPTGDIVLNSGEIKSTLLLHCDDFTDSSKYSHILTNADVDIDTTIKKFGSGSMLFNTNTDYIEIDKTDFDFANNDFTIDFWAYPTAFTGMIMGSWGNRSTSSFAILNSGNKLAFAYSDAQSGGQIIIDTSALMVLNEWQHIAITRANDTLYFFINGVLTHAVTFTPTIKAPTNNVWIGKNYDIGGNPNDRYSGYLDEIRIINGECMWTENFTPPTEPYQN